MTILIITVVTISSLIACTELFCLACCAIKAYNHHKYGNDWGKLPDWLYNIVDRIAL